MGCWPLACLIFNWKIILTNNLRFDGKAVHADHIGVSVRELMQFAALHYVPGGSRYFDVLVRDVFVGRFCLKIDKQTKQLDAVSLYPRRFD